MSTPKKGAAPKGNALPMKRSPQQKAALARAEKQALEKANAQRLAQIVNLHIAGVSLSDIGRSIGATADEVDRMLQTDAARYVKTQPALRVYVRNYVSAKYAELLDAVWEDATDKSGNQGKLTAAGFDKKLASQDRAIKILDRMAKLHGADAPVQQEIKVETAPEAVDKLVQVLAQQQGIGYDVDIFDIVDAEIVEDAVAETGAALEVSRNRVGDSDGEDEL